MLMIPLKAIQKPTTMNMLITLMPWFEITRFVQIYRFANAMTLVRL